MNSVENNHCPTPKSVANLGTVHSKGCKKTVSYLFMATEKNLNENQIRMCFQRKINCASLPVAANPRHSEGNSLLLQAFSCRTARDKANPTLLF